MRKVWVFIGLCLLLGILLVIDILTESLIIHYAVGVFGLLVFLLFIPIRIKDKDEEFKFTYTFLIMKNKIFKQASGTQSPDNADKQG